MRTPKRLVGPAQLTTTAATQYTVPALTKTLIRFIHAANPTGSAVTLTISIGSDASGTRIFDAYSVGAGTVFNPPCYHVLEAAEILQAKAGTATALVLTVDGDEFTLGY